MIDAEHSQDFQAALKERDSQYGRHFCDGIAEGRRKQKEDLDEQVQFFRAACQDAEVALARSLEENLALGREIKALQCRLQTPVPTRTQNNGLALHGRSSTSIGISDQSSPTKERQPTHSSLSYAAAASFKVASTMNPTSMPIQQPGKQHTASTSHRLPPRPSGPLPMSRSGTLHAVAQAPSTPRSNLFPRTLQDLEWLMRAAREPGNGRYLAMVEALYTEAHATPRERKTDLQEVVLSKWRNPAHSGVVKVSSPLPESSSDLDRKKNPRLEDSVETWYSYLCTHQKSWPRGVRKDLLGRPIMSDLRASRMISRLRPEAGLERSPPNLLVSPRAAFMQQVIGLFSKPGTYQQILVRDNIKVAESLSYLPFNERSGSITIETLVYHCATCGITVKMATEDFEPWARNYLKEFSSTLQPQ